MAVASSTPTPAALSSSSSPPKLRKTSPLGGRTPSKFRNKTPVKVFRRSPRGLTYVQSPKNEELKKEQKATEEKVMIEQTGQEDSLSEYEAFEDHSEFCKRMAKNFYFANKLPSTPRISLPMTMLAVNTFATTARKDTLEFLDIEMAAEIGRNACVSPTALIMALVYLERLSSSNPGYLNSIKPSELFVVSLLVASKFIQDDGEDLGIFNDEWATSAQMKLKILNRLELQFLTAIDWRVNVDKIEFDVMFKRLENKLALNQGLYRGWFTYTEIGTLTSSLLSWNLIWPTLYEHCIKVISAAIMTYASVLATVITSSLLAPQVFIMSKFFMTASISSLQLLNSMPISYLNNDYFNVSFGVYPSQNQPLNYRDIMQTNPEILNDEENDTDISISLENYFMSSLSHHENSWKYRMSTGLKSDLGNVQKNLKRSYQEEEKKVGSLILSNDYVFKNHLKHFLKLSSCGIGTEYFEKNKHIEQAYFSNKCHNQYQEFQFNNFRSLVK